MSDFEADDITPLSASFSDTGNENLTEIPPPAFEPRKTAEREGLPASYRMRADAHYVDQLTARSNEVPLRLIAVDDIDEPESAGSIDAADLQPLVQSIAEHGVVQPLLVRREANRYHLIAGRKRLVAARAASVGRVPCLVHQATEVQADVLAFASNIRVEAAPSAPPTPATNGLDAAAIASVTESVTAIQSAAAMLAGDGSPMARRVSLDLVRAEAWRATWQLRAASILEGGHPWRFQPILLGAILGRVRDAFAAERRLSGIELRVNVADWNVSADLDEEAVLCGVTGAVIASAGLLGDAEPPELTLAARRPEGKMLTIEITQDRVSPESAAAGHFFDPTWIARPGGRSALLGAAVARLVAERHGGAAAFTANGRRGSTVRLTLGRSASVSRH